MDFGAVSRGVVPHAAVSSRRPVQSAVSAGTWQYEKPRRQPEILKIRAVNRGNVIFMRIFGFRVLRQRAMFSPWTSP